MKKIISFLKNVFLAIYYSLYGPESHSAIRYKNQPH